MKDFNKLLKLTWKRYAIWIVLLGFFFTLSTSLSLKNNLKWEEINLIDAVTEMKRDLGLDTSHLSDSKIDKTYLDESRKIAEAYAKKYSLKETEEKIIERADENNDIWDKYSIHDRYKRLIDLYSNNDYLLREKLDSSLSVTFFFIIILAMAQTSIEESLKYYDFTRMLPWSKKKEFFMKMGIALIFGLGLFIINALLSFAIIKGSVFSEIVSLSGLGVYLLKAILLLLSASLVSVSLGLLAGNFLGHVGLAVIAVGFIEWFKMIVFSFATIFDKADKLNDAYYEFKGTLNPASKVFLSLTNVDFDKLSSVVAGLVVAGIIALLSYMLIGKSSAERSGYMVKNEVITEIAKWSGILSLCSILFVITTGFISFESFNIPVRIFIYALSFLISYKFFDILFKVRLKF